MSVYKVNSRGAEFVVVDAMGNVVGSCFSTRQKALATVRKLEGIASGATKPCLSCGRPFLSEGPHNRMCKECKRGGSA